LWDSAGFCEEPGEQEQQSAAYGQEDKNEFEMINN
jgi:hypothetical protein